MKKILIFIMLVLLVLCSSLTVFGAGYTDLKNGHWAYDAISLMSDRTIIRGYPDGSFKPDSTVTYGEFIKMAEIAASGEDAGNSGSGNWAMNYYNKALELKYFTEYDIRKTDLSNKIDRAHMALIVSSILGDLTIENYDQIQDGITDITYETPYEYDITKAYAKGILTGYEDKTFRPEKTLSRAEAATVIYRLMDESKRVYPGDEASAPEVETVDVKVGTMTLTYNLQDVNLGYGGVQKIEVVKSNGRIAIYSSIKYEAIKVIVENQSIGFMVFTTGLTYYKDGEYYVYLANPNNYNIDINGKQPTLMFINSATEHIDTIYKFTDVTF